MSEAKQIEEMAETLDEMCDLDLLADCEEKDCSKCMATALYNAGYRRQREGEWKIKSEIYQMFDDVDEELYVECPFCGRTFWVPYEFDDQKTFEYAREHYPYCNCGAKMKGGGAE